MKIYENLGREIRYFSHWNNEGRNEMYTQKERFSIGCRDGTLLQSAEEAPRFADVPIGRLLYLSCIYFQLIHRMTRCWMITNLSYATLFANFDNVQASRDLQYLTRKHPRQ